MGPGIGYRRLHGRRHQLVGQCAGAGRRREHLDRGGGDTRRQVGQVGARRVLQRAERVVVPRRPTVGADHLVEGAVDALVDQYFGTFPRSVRPLRPLAVAPPPAPVRSEIVDPFAALRRIHRAWLGPTALATDEAELDILTAGWSSVGTGALWRRLVYDAPLAQRVSAWTMNGRLGGELHVAVDLRTGADPAAVRAILDEECARGVDALAIERSVTRREASTVWGLSSLTRRVGLLQRGMLYANDPDVLASELQAYRAVTTDSITAALGRWLGPEKMIEIETVPGAPTVRA